MNINAATEPHAARSYPSYTETQLISTSESARRHQVILAPAASAFLNPEFRNVHYEPEWYEQILGEVQRLRGRVYLHDGAIQQEQLSADGRHISPVDSLSWHIVTLDERGLVVACARLHEHAPSAGFEDLSVSGSALAKSPKWGRRLRAAVQSVRKRAYASAGRFIEAGGWGAR